MANMADSLIKGWTSNSKLPRENFMVIRPLWISNAIIIKATSRSISPASNEGISLGF